MGIGSNVSNTMEALKTTGITFIVPRINMDEDFDGYGL